MRPLLVVAVAAALLTGCGDRSAVQEGGRVPGDVVTVYTLVPDTRAGREVIQDAKQALFDAGGEAGKVTVQFASRTLPTGTDAIADTVEAVVRDTGTIAVIDAGPPQVTAPLLNAVGILHVSLAPEADVEQPAARATYFPVTADAMETVLEALRLAGDRATVRSAVIERVRFSTMRVLIVIAAAFVLAAPARAADGPTVRFDTSLGAIDVRLLPDDAPNTVATFLRYVADKTYDSTYFHRSVADFIIQGGGYKTANNQTTPVNELLSDVDPFKRSNTRGTIATAKLPGQPNRATSQFFFNEADNSALDDDAENYTVFGRINDRASLCRDGRDRRPADRRRKRRRSPAPPSASCRSATTRAGRSPTPTW